MRKFNLVVLILFGLCVYTNSSNIINNDYRKELIVNNNEAINVDKLIKSLIQIESMGEKNAISSDGECVGILQIKKIVVDDCNEYLQMKGINKKYCYDDRFDEAKSIEMFLLIQERYRNFKRYRCNNYIEHMIRLWNGGCNYQISKTDTYYKKVIKVYDTL